MRVITRDALDAVRENRTLARWATLLPRPPQQVGRVHETDAELVPLGDGRLLALTVDSVVEELEAGLYSPRTAGRIAALACVSDLSAVGAEPLGLLLAVTLPPAGAARLQEAIAAGVQDACDAAGTAVLGGDTAEGDAVSVTAVGAGTLPAPALTRCGCRPGERIFATGPLGLGAAYAAARLMGMGPGPIDFDPVPRTAAGAVLRHRASACIDTSDGLLAAVDQLARLNRVGIALTVELDELLHPAARELGRATGLPAFPFLASHHGEFELVFTVPESEVSDLASLGRRGDFDPVYIGRVEERPGVRWGSVEVDCARLRNLAHGCAADPAAYAARLMAATPA